MEEKVDQYLEGLNQWKEELTLLRRIVLDCGLIEEFKWMHPCYSHKEKNIVLIHEFKAYCAISFFKGALLRDPEKVLIQPTENVQAGRQIRFTAVEQINHLETLLKQYIHEAVEIERLGLQVSFKKTADFEIPGELRKKFKSDPDLKAAFEHLSPGRQKGYLLYYSKAKQSGTRTSRIEASRERILKGYGLRDCVCGLSKRKPNCDGSHKQLKTRTKN